MTHTVRFRTGPLVRAAGIVALGLAVVACGNAAAAGSSATPTPSGGGGFRGNGNFAEGTVVQLSSTTLTLASTSGTDETVTFTSSTPITQTSTGSYEDITVGSCVTGTGTKDATGVVTVASVTVTPPVNGSCADPALRGQPRRLPERTSQLQLQPPGHPLRAFPPDFAAVRGMVTAVAGTSVTVQGTAGSQTVTVPTTVKVDMSAPGSTSDLSNGVCVVAAGTKDSSGSVAARSLSIEPPAPRVASRRRRRVPRRRRFRRLRRFRRFRGNRRVSQRHHDLMSPDDLRGRPVARD